MQSQTRSTNNITSKTVNGATTAWSYNSADELTTGSYDANGNQTHSLSGLTLAYNAKDQTTSITPSGGSAIGMTYRGSGQTERVGAGGSSYQYDSTGLSQVTTPASGTAYLTTTPDGAVLSERLSSGTYDYLHDGLGSVVGVTNSSGSLVNQYSYDPYGNATSVSETVSNPFRFIGAIWESSTGLYKMGERYYDPSIGRFTQLDPLGGGYVYAGDDPANLTDPSGLCPLCAVAVAVGVGVGAVTGVDEVVAGVVAVGAVAYEGTKVGQAINQAVSKHSSRSGHGFRGGKQKARDRDFGIKDKDFWKWWDREGKRTHDGRDITNRREAEEIYKEGEEHDKRQP